MQIVNGSGSTSNANGAGNLVLGYDASPGTQSGSHNLVLGTKQSYTGYADIVGGYNNSDTSNYGAMFGDQNTDSGAFTLVAGASNSALGSPSTVIGGFDNAASEAYSSILGGCSNRAGTGNVSLSSDCGNSTNFAHDFATISGGAGNETTGNSASVSGGESNLAGDVFASITGGCQGLVGGGSPLSATCLKGSSAVLGGFENTATGLEDTVAGGEVNDRLGRCRLGGRRPVQRRLGRRRVRRRRGREHLGRVVRVDPRRLLQLRHNVRRDRERRRDQLLDSHGGIGARRRWQHGVVKLPGDPGGAGILLAAGASGGSPGCPRSRRPTLAAGRRGAWGASGSGGLGTLDRLGLLATDRDLDLPRLARLGLRYMDFEHAALEACADCVSIDALGERQRATERAE